ncbi:MAG: ATP-binding protein [Verrucomicrobia bacterium]|nr:ATP-binding protein [Verrucomicrobiota bacterium]
MPKLPWKPWHEVVTLRPDLASGELSLQQFAADLYEVVMQTGQRPVYEKPENFFALTYPTYNLRELVREVVLRLAGQNDKAVRQLALTYGGGKTHTLITLRHLVFDPDKLPDLASVQEFEQAIGQQPPKARVAALCFDSFDTESGADVLSPDGEKRRLKMPWSALAYQLAGDAGLKVLHPDGKAEERDSAPATNLLTELLALPAKDGLATLILIDEVLMYAHGKVSADETWRGRLRNFFQYLTQAATKTDRCCIVASLLASDPKKDDKLGRELRDEYYDIFGRTREAVVEPVVKEDVAEVLRRRFFTPKSIENRDAFRQHVVAALKGIAALDEQTAKQGAAEEERFLRSFPFHPELTEVFYSKWTSISGFQRTRGVLRTFALALRDAVKWDACPLIGPGVFLNAANKDGLSEAAGELVTYAESEGEGGGRQAWTGILVGELDRARQIQQESVGLKCREMEQAVMATFLHSQPQGRNAKTRDLSVLLGPTRPDKIELEKALTRWAVCSHWLDDAHTGPASTGQLPAAWKLGNRPNLAQMHAAASKEISDDVVKARLLDEIAKVKALTSGASALGIKVHTLPAKPKDIEDDGAFHYAVLGPGAASEFGKPSPEAKRYLDETTGADKPRVFRNAVILLTPSKDGLELAHNRIREYLAWEQVRLDLDEQQKNKKGSVDVARLHTLLINIEKSKGKIPDAIKQAWCIVCTVSDKNAAQGFKITVSEEPHFLTIKEDQSSRVQDTAVSAEALLPNGPYNLWREAETSRRVKDLAGAFAQMPHLPKMLKAEAIVSTLVEGCAEGTFVLRLTRPNRTFRTWWRSKPDDAALADPALELVLPQAAELSEIAPGLLSPNALPSLWAGEEITAKTVADYFSGSKIVQVDKGGYNEPVQIPKASPDAVAAAVTQAVQAAQLWLLSGPASLLAEPIPPGILNDAARLRPPPPAVLPADILPANLPTAWKDGATTALSIASALSQKQGATLPWKTVHDVIQAGLSARFVELTDGSGAWPCDFPAAQTVKLKLPAQQPTPATGGLALYDATAKLLIGSTELEPAQLQDLAELAPDLLEIKAQTGVPIRFHLRLEAGDGKERPAPKAADKLNAVLAKLKKDFSVS